MPFFIPNEKRKYYVDLPLNDFASNWLLLDSSLFKKETKQQTKH